MGVDPTLHYNRTERRFYPEELKFTFPSDTLSKVRYTKNDHKRPMPDVERVLIGFCGILYPCIRVIHSEREIANIYLPAQLDTYFKHKIPERRHRKEWRERAAFLTNRPCVDGLFLEVDAPLFVVSDDPDERGQSQRIDTNLPLKPYEFFKVIDPFTAFQEISMYLGNQLVKHDQPDSIADEYRIAMHGYDRYSFRHPTRASKLA